MDYIFFRLCPQEEGVGMVTLTLTDGLHVSTLKLTPLVIAILSVGIKLECIGTQIVKKSFNPQNSQF